jgi:hypothetical protein
MLESAIQKIETGAHFSREEAAATMEELLAGRA